MKAERVVTDQTGEMTRTDSEEEVEEAGCSKKKGSGIKSENGVIEMRE